jgi:DNA-binding NarL/FixJ family response regulator
MTIVLFTNDLMFQSRIESVVRGAGNRLVVVRNWEAIESRFDSEQSPECVVFDLSFRGLDLSDAVNYLRLHHPASKLIAYGPHVDTDLLKQASDLGIEEVMTRGQFDRNMSTVLSSTYPHSPE